MTVYVDDPDFTLLCGDALEQLRTLPEGSVHCPCGCGETFSPVGSRGRLRRFYSPACSLRVNRVSGGGEGRRHTDATRAILSAKARVPKPWLRGERNGMAGRTGESNPNWRGGSSPERQRLYAGAAWRKLRRTVLARDNGECQGCGSPADLHLHHVKPWATHPDLRFDPDNVVLLCRPVSPRRAPKGGVPSVGSRTCQIQTSRSTPATLSASSATFRASPFTAF